MTTMQLSLPDDLAAYVAGQAKAKGHSSLEACVLEVLREASRAQAQADLEASLVAEVEALDRGEGSPMTREDWQELREAISQRYGKGA